MRQIDIDIQPKLHSLQVLNLSEADFNGALETALEGLVGVPTHQLPTPGNIALQLRGHEYRLGDLARIDVSLDGSPASARL
jgi:hypothetical protein